MDVVPDATNDSLCISMAALVINIALDTEPRHRTTSEINKICITI